MTSQCNFPGPDFQPDMTDRSRPQTTLQSTLRSIFCKHHFFSFNISHLLFYSASSHPVIVFVLVVVFSLICFGFWTKTAIGATSGLERHLCPLRHKGQKTTLTNRRTGPRSRCHIPEIPEIRLLAISMKNRDRPKARISPASQDMTSAIMAPLLHSSQPGTRL